MARNRDRKLRAGEQPVQPTVETDALITVHHEGLDRTIQVRRSRLAQMDPAWRPVEDEAAPSPTAVTPNQDVPPTDKSEE